MAAMRVAAIFSGIGMFLLSFLNARQDASSAAALLVLLAGAAGAGLVASDLRLIARDGLRPGRFLTRCGRSLIRPREGQRRRTARGTPLLNLLGRLLRDNL